MTKKIFHKQLNLFNFLKIKKLRKKLNEKAGLGLSEIMQPRTDILRSISEIFLQEGTMAWQTDRDRLSHFSQKTETTKTF